MTQEQRRDIIEAVGLIAIVASLIFLALEVREANLASRIAARDSITQGHLDFMGAVIDQSVLPRAFWRLRDEELTDYEAHQIRLHNERRWRHYERVYFMYKYGVLSDNEWEGFRVAIHSSINGDSPFWQSTRYAWQYYRKFLSDEFVDYVEMQAERND